MFEFHKDKNVYFSYQYYTSRDHIIPFIKEFIDLDQKLNILEIGCAEAGVLKAFTELGHQCVGIELNASRVELAKQFMAEELVSGKIKFIAKDIYDIDVDGDLGTKFDVIILKDVIEHIHNQEKFMKELKKLMKPDGIVFFGFPPWMMPFGGHQQISSKKLLSIIPYYHLLPMPIYKGILRLFGEKQGHIDSLEEIKETGISIERFEKICKKEDYAICKKKFFLTNPIYQYKFNLKTRKQLSVISGIPWLRNFLTTAAYYVVKN